MLPTMNAPSEDQEQSLTLGDGTEVVVTWRSRTSRRKVRSEIVDVRAASDSMLTSAQFDEAVRMLLG
jgi:hypothetical protein